MGNNGFSWGWVDDIARWFWKMTFGSLFAPVGIVRKVFAWGVVIFIVIALVWTCSKGQ